MCIEKGTTLPKLLLASNYSYRLPNSLPIVPTPSHLSPLISLTIQHTPFSLPILNFIFSSYLYLFLSLSHPLPFFTTLTRSFLPFNTTSSLSISHESFPFLSRPLLPYSVYFLSYPSYYYSNPVNIIYYFYSY